MLRASASISSRSASSVSSDAGLTRAQSELFNARLILLLANQVGDAGVLEECVKAAATAPPVGVNR